MKNNPAIPAASPATSEDLMLSLIFLDEVVKN